MTTSGLDYKHMTILNDASSVVSKWSSKVIDDARVIIYDGNLFIIKATGWQYSVSSPIVIMVRVIIYCFAECRGALKTL